MIYLCVFIVSFCSAAEDLRRNNRFTIESRGDFTQTLTRDLQKFHFYLLYQITSSVYIFEYKGNGNAEIAKDLIIDSFRDQIEDIEPTRVYNNTIKPVHTPADGIQNNLNMTNLVCSNYYGMGVEKVWARNITGKGVTLAINDIGIDTDLRDLERNINKELCMDFFTNTSDVSPNHFTDVVREPPLIADHGNQVASVTAAIKNNNLCSAGIAYDATLVGLKMCMLQLVGNTFNYESESEILSRALSYKFNEIDIFVNAWAPVYHFDQLDLATRKAIEDGATKGRRGLGAIHVVPAGSFANKLSNNIHTITVNGIPRFGQKHADTVLDASVLVSGLRDGNNLTASSMVTTSYRNKCVRTFKGVSAAVSQVSGIIALGLQANPVLKLRDVQHLLVQASNHEQLAKNIHIKSNGASRQFNYYFGFGLLNADKFVTLAQKHKPVQDLMSRTLVEYSKRNSGVYTQMFEFCYDCDRDYSCLSLIEQVTLEIGFSTSADELTTEITSPGGTQSMLMDLKLDQRDVPLTQKGTFVSVHFWDEVPFGKWRVKVQTESSSNITTVHHITLILHGTSHAGKENYLIHCGKDKINEDFNDSDSPQIVTSKTTDNSTESRNDVGQHVIIIIVVAIAFIVVVFVLLSALGGCNNNTCCIWPHHIDIHYDTNASVRSERQILPVGTPVLEMVTLHKVSSFKS